MGMRGTEGAVGRLGVRRTVGVAGGMMVLWRCAATRSTAEDNDLAAEERNPNCACRSLRAARVGGPMRGGLGLRNGGFFTAVEGFLGWRFIGKGALDGGEGKRGQSREEARTGGQTSYTVVVRRESGGERKNRGGRNFSYVSEQCLKRMVTASGRLSVQLCCHMGVYLIDHRGHCGDKRSDHPGLDPEGATVRWPV